MFIHTVILIIHIPSAFYTDPICILRRSDLNPTQLLGRVACKRSVLVKLGNVAFHVEAIHFRRGVQGHVFVQITFENCSLNFYFENGKIVITSMEHFYMLTDFYAASF